MESLKILFFLFLELSVVALYPLIIVTVVLTLNVGVFSWLIIVCFTSPLVALWYFTVKKRVEAHWRMLLDSKGRVWDIDKTLAEYIAMLKKKKTK